MDRNEITCVMLHELRMQMSRAKILFFAASYALIYFILGKFYIFLEVGLFRKFLGMTAGPQAAADGKLSLDQFQGVIQYFTGGQIELAEHLARTPLIVLFLFWASLTLLPYFILLGSYDSFAGDIFDRSIRFVLVRASRASVFAGKMLAHSLVFATLTLVVNTGMVFYAATQLPSFDLPDILLYSLRYWAITLVCILTFLSFCALFSVMISRPVLALSASILAFFLLLHVKHVPQIAFLSPLSYTRLLWHPFGASLLGGVGIFAGFGAACFLSGVLILSRRDL